ncbi:hypothetical protein SAMN05443429_1204 [Cruoricaptor ignavus]|uniref:TolB-like 6-blade propeller-like n=2 Tax=Cruoricaptor ignavus TaxID=1118202 RepID=A0A1M6HV23_9FLAO|nr:hypothetical protein SAMN05443429_1204 [Cruoricaptor ignavus]
MTIFMKKNIIITVSIVISIILILLVWSKSNKHENNIINRKYLNSLNFQQLTSFNLKKGANKLDVFDNEIFLQNSEKKDISLIEGKSENLIFNYGALIKNNFPESYTIIVDSIFMFYPSKRAVFKSNLKNSNVLVEKKLELPFTRGVAVDNGFVIKECITADCINQQFTLYSKDFKVQKNFDVISHRNDGGLTQDGFFVKGKNELFFISYLLPDIFCFDSEGNFKYKFTTIDNRDDNLEVVKLRKAAYTFKKNPFYHQLTASIGGNILYVHSNISDQKKDSNSDIIDMYQISDGSYIGSFTLPPRNNIKVFDYKILGNNFLVLYADNELVKYKFNKPQNF